MKNKIIAAALAVIAIIFAVAMPAAAGDAVVDEKSVIDGIVEFKIKQSGVENAQEFIDKTLAEGAGASSEWYVLALSRYGNNDFSKYAAALDAYISEGHTLGAATNQKLAIAQIAAGYATTFTDTVVDKTLDGGGVMSMIFGLHLLNIGAPSEKYTATSVARELLKIRKADGGWALSGDHSDVDVTAMALTAISPHKDIDGADDAIDDALSFLSSRQLDDGGYKSMMSDENPESAAQVLLALSSLGIYYGEDARFIKNKNTILDAMMRFAVGDGSFSHSVGGAYNSSATVQVMYSLVGVLRMKNGMSPLFMLNYSGTKRIEKSAPTGESGVPTYKIIASAALVFIFAVVCVILIVAKKRNYKNFIAASVILCAALLFVWLTTFTSAENYYGKEIIKKNPVGSVSITVRCDTIVGKSNDKHIPVDGVVLANTKVPIERGETVYDILIQCARKYGIQIDVDAAGYFAGIGNIYQLQFGQLSGWMYFVNGEEASVSADRYVLSDGDVIEWLYTCDIGNDLKK